MFPAALHIAVNEEADIRFACREARQLAECLGFSRISAYHIATATSELATNLWVHAGGGELHIRALLPGHEQEIHPGLELIAEDRGPGIANVALALTEGYSTCGGLGCGLPGVKRLMDELTIHSIPGRGTQIKAIKWR